MKSGMFLLLLIESEQGVGRGTNPVHTGPRHVNTVRSSDNEHRMCMTKSVRCIYPISHCTALHMPEGLPQEHVVVSGSNPEELGPLLHGTGGRALGNMNHQQMDPCGGGSSPPSTNLGGARPTTMSNPWHLLHAMRAMRIASQDPPTDSADIGDIPLGGEPPGKENDSSFGVS
jgi:hypothetical protein